jgi:hypothetical protein
MSQTEQDQIQHLSRLVSYLLDEVTILRLRVGKHDAILINRMRRDGMTWKAIFEEFPYLSRDHVCSMRAEPPA